MQSTLVPALIATCLLSVALPEPLQAREVKDHQSQQSVRTPSLDLAITRTDADTWLAEFAFDAKVQTLDFGPAPEGYRASAWRLTDEPAGHWRDERWLHLAEPVSSLTVEISLYHAYPPSFYVPMARFSNDGAALYTGYLLPDIVAGDDSQTPPTRVAPRGRPGELALLTRHGREGAPGFAYFGPRVDGNTPAPGASTTDWGFADVIIDPGLPKWIQHLFREVLEEVSSIFLRELPDALTARPLILAAAGDLDSIEGYSIKGGALGDQILFTLRGPALREESPAFRRQMEKLMAHELAHLWQRGLASRSRDTKDPWVHEGGAEAMALAALGEAGIWNEPEIQSFADRRAQDCEEATRNAQLEEIQGRNYDAVYSCGLTRFRRSGVNVYQLWARIERLGEAGHRPFNAALFADAARELGATDESGTAP